MCLICGMVLLAWGSGAYAQEAPKEPSGKSLGAIADDIKFENALQFYAMGDYGRLFRCSTNT